MGLRCGRSVEPLKPRVDARPEFSVGGEAYYGDGAQVVDEATAQEKEADQMRRYRASVRRAAANSRIMSAILDVRGAVFRVPVLLLPFGHLVIVVGFVFFLSSSSSSPVPFLGPFTFPSSRCRSKSIPDIRFRSPSRAI